MKIMKVCFMLAFLLLFGISCGSFAENANKTQTHRYFIYDHGPGHGEYLWLQSNGSYWLGSRGIEGELYYDEGAWSQKGDEITLKSGRKLRDILSPSGCVKVEFGGLTKDNKELSDYIASVKKALIEFLEKNKSNKFTDDEVEKIYSYKYKGLNSPSIYLFNKVVDRASLENLIKGIDDFIVSNEKNAFHGKIEKNKSSTCFFLLDGSMSTYTSCFEEVSKDVFEKKSGIRCN